MAMHLPDKPKSQAAHEGDSLSSMGEAIKGFIEITPERVLQMVERIGVRATGRVLQLNSMENRVFEVEVECSEPQSKYDSYRVVKFMRPGRWTYDQVKEEHLFLNALREEGIPVGAPLAFKSGDTVERDPHSGIMAAVFPRIGGRSPDELTDSHCLQLGRMMARTHLVGAALPINKRLQLDADTYGAENLEWMYQNSLIPGDIENQYLDVAEEVVALSKSILKNFKKQTIHGDCHLGNVLTGSSGLFLIDFDDMVIGPKIQDLWLLMSGIDDYGLNQLELLIRGYNEIGKFDCDEIIAIEPLRALRYIHYASWIAKRWADPAFPRSFPHFGSREYWLSQIRDLEVQKIKISELI